MSLQFLELTFGRSREQVLDLMANAWSGGGGWWCGHAIVGGSATTGSSRSDGVNEVTVRVDFGGITRIPAVKHQDAFDCLPKVGLRKERARARSKARDPAILNKRIDAIWILRIDSYIDRPASHE